MLMFASGLALKAAQFICNVKGQSAVITHALTLLAAMLLSMEASSDEGPQRLISTDAAITEIVIALGGAHRLVGVDDTSVLPEDQSALPRLGYHRALNAEGLLSLRPDLLLISEHAGPARALAPLEAASVSVLRLSSAQDVPGLKSNVRLITAALGMAQEGERLLGEIDARARLIRSYSSATPSRAVLLRESNGELRVAGLDSAGNALLVLLGAENAVDYQGYRTFTAEGLLALDPEILVIADEALPSAAQWLSRYPLLRYSKAAQAQAVVSIDSRALVGGLSLRALSEGERLLKAMTKTQQVASP